MLLIEYSTDAIDTKIEPLSSQLTTYNPVLPAPLNLSQEKLIELKVR